MGTILSEQTCHTLYLLQYKITLQQVIGCFHPHLSHLQCLCSDMTFSSSLLFSFTSYPSSSSSFSFFFYSQLTFLILQYLSLCCCFFHPLTAQMPLSFFFHLAHLSLHFLSFLSSVSLSLSLFLSSVSCKLQYHMSRMSSASNKADWLCLVLLTDRQTHVSSQSPMWDHSTSDWHTCLPVKLMQRRQLTYKCTNIITQKYPYTKEHST